jgi:hypothetical protein
VGLRQPFGEYVREDEAVQEWNEQILPPINIGSTQPGDRKLLRLLINNDRIELIIAFCGSHPRRDIPTAVIWWYLISLNTSADVI